MLGVAGANKELPGTYVDFFIEKEGNVSCFTLALLVLALAGLAILVLALTANFVLMVTPGLPSSSSFDDEEDEDDELILLSPYNLSLHKIIIR